MTTTIEHRGTRGTIRRKAGALLLALCYLAGPAVQTAQAAPALPQVVNGQATFNQQGNVFSITNTPGAIINWQSFNIGAGEVTRFIQQSSDSAVLNRIVGQDPTRILGALQSNGKVFLINPNGILFGQGSRVDVNGLVASTLNLSDADFLAGKKNLRAGAGASTGAVRNDGAITTPNGGKVFLVAPNVQNTGIITAPNGEVVLAAGRSVQLLDSSDPNLQVVVSAPSDQALNLGKVIAQGGRIGIFGALVSQRGTLNADSAVVGENGRIVLKASGATTLGAGSSTSATAAGKGGEIQVLGAQVAIEGGASVDASGQLGGGAVLVGGDYQGGNNVQRAQSTRVDAGASIRADATVDGNGGKIVLWSDGDTRAHGSLSARGAGNNGGNGGLIETSGHVLDVNGIAVNAAGAKGGKGGKNGSWLLDPYDIEVVAGGTAGANDVGAPGNGAATGVTKVAPSTLTSAGADVVLQAQHDLTITNTIEAAGSVRAQAGNDIVVNARVASREGDLDFRAGNAFVLGAGGSLATGNYIDIAANSVTLGGGIDKGTAGQLPILTFTSSDPSRAIVVGAGTADPGTLWLDAATLGRLSSGLYEINLGNSRHTGPVQIKADLTASSSLVMENAGRIAVDAKVDLTSNPESRAFASLYGGADSRIQVSGALSASKAVTLDGGSGTVEIREGARVSSASGAVSITGASTQIAAGTVSQGGQPAPTPPTPTPPTPPTPPTLDSCIATPGAAGCAAVIAQEIQACTIAPNGANCGKVMPKLETCQLDAAAPGCSVILAHHDIDVCLANPQQAGCAAKIPAYAACQADPSGYGCGAVIQRHDQVSACIANPAAPGCAQALPTLAECRADAGVYGCVPVLARAQFESCVAHPEGAGCLANVLPKLAVCKLTPSLEGCAQVLEATFQSCLANPNDPSCGGVLPTISQCVSNSAGRGCDAVLPTLAQCIGSPSLQGCSVRLPSLQACAASPSTPGCQAVLPQPDYCGAHPSDPTCAVFGGNGGTTDVQAKPVAQAVQGTVHLINQGASTVVSTTGIPAGDDDNKAPGQTGKVTGAAQAENSGAKNEKPATKMYCN
jgi:filamentous hemagglutinin family protein